MSNSRRIALVSLHGLNEASGPRNGCQQLGFAILKTYPEPGGEEKRRKTTALVQLGHDISLLSLLLLNVTVIVFMDLKFVAKILQSVMHGVSAAPSSQTLWSETGVSGWLPIRSRLGDKALYALFRSGSM